MNELPEWLSRPVQWQGTARTVLKLGAAAPVDLSEFTRAKMRTAAKKRCARAPKVDSAISRVLAFIESHPGIRTRSIVIAGLKPHTVTNALSELHTQGKVRREGEPWRFKYWPIGKSNG